MNYEQAEAYLYSTVSEVASPRTPYRLDRMRYFLEVLGNPQRRYPSLHIGGTSGKSSTATMIAAILTASGKRCGLHTKPHLESMTQRARIDGVSISHERFAELLTDMGSAIEEVTREYSRPSYYETLLALAFLHFALERVDIAVIEVGLGGTLDGTNVITPLVSVITNIGLDHTDVLGDTLEAIAADKVGIAKPGVPLVTAVSDPGAERVIRAGCAAAGAPYVSVQSQVRAIEDQVEGQYGQSFVLRTNQANYKVEMPLLGDFQIRNAAAAVVALEQLPTLYRVTPLDVEQGFESVHIAGRMEVLPGNPTVVFDVAHNSDKARSFAHALRAHFGDDHRYWFVIAIGENKDAKELLESFTGFESSFIFTTFHAAGRTAARPQRLASIAQDLGLWGREISDPVEALSIARRNAEQGDIVVVTGSTFVVADLRAWWLENVGTQAPAG
ncbi:MAG: bifunctional folylpolyglutamate synthase/dihydrofolate synthase [Candidatus Eremiobacteraeota bacterium]|nr:bifunctional folylpolyglutamate synthase/dihydrofolate synthase [Candidatus Eremiobacteraeota bacterium]